MEVHKLLVANRGEIAVRVMRAAQELSFSTVAIYSEADELAGHHQIADASYMIGKPGELGPVDAYLHIDKIIEIARKNKVDLIHPGYGFLSENAEFAAKAGEAGIKFAGPPIDVLESMGDKVAARHIARSCNIPTIPGTNGPVQCVQDAHDFVHQHGYPVVVKASFGGGGRGMRVVREGDSLEEALESARSEALSAFGNGTVFLERYLARPKHIEVQVLSDKYGNHIHLFERDCSVQRKHQKVVEFAPATSISSAVRKGLFDASVRLAAHLKYESAGTVEFLVENEQFYFIEMNPRIQVEHTVTEEITGIDIVQAQLKIACGASLPELGLTQERISQRGCAIQCRIAAEIPSQGFCPDSGRLEFCRLPTGKGVRLDYSEFIQGIQISPFYDSLLVKATCLGEGINAARQKAIRALKEFQAEGVQTNTSFLLKLLEHQIFVDGGCWTRFIDDTPELLVLDSEKDKGQQLLKFLGDAAVNGCRIQGQIRPPAFTGDIQLGSLLDPVTNEKLDITKPCVEGWRDQLLKYGPREYANIIRAQKGTLITDTTWRDGQQSLLATRIRTRDFAKVAIHTSHAFKSAYSMEVWGGATFDVALRFLHECPWERLRRLRKLVPNVPFQMLLRSVNGVAYSALPDNALYHFVRHAKNTGVDIFRVFDSLNDLENLEVGISAVLAAGGLVEGAIMYTGDMLDPGCKYNLAYYMAIVDKLIEFGSHILAIKSMSGVMKPAAGRVLVRTIREKYPDIPIHMHTHDTNGTGIATMLACVDEGADIVDTAIDSLSGSTSQPAMSAMVATLENTKARTEMSIDQIRVIDAYWAQLRLVYAGFDADLRSPDPTVYTHEIPGGQYSNLVFQARQNGLGDQWAETQRAYTDANHLLGDIIKATPTSKAVGDLAQFMVDGKLSSSDILHRASTLDFPSSVLDYFSGRMGQPFDGFPEPLRTDALRGREKKISNRADLALRPVDFDRIGRRIMAEYPSTQLTDDDIASYVMYPEVYMAFRKARAEFGDITELPTSVFLTAMEVGQQVKMVVKDGRELVAELVAIAPASKLTGKREVLFRLNGSLRSVHVLDDKEKPKKVSRKADTQTGEVGAPISGTVVRVTAQDGTVVRAGEALVTISAMKMEVNVTAEVGGRIDGVSVVAGDTVAKEDVLVKIVPNIPNGTSNCTPIMRN